MDKWLHLVEVDTELDSMTILIKNKRSKKEEKPGNTTEKLEKKEEKRGNKERFKKKIKKTNGCTW